MCFLRCHGPWPGCLLLSTFRVIGLISLQHPEILVVPSGKNQGKRVYSVSLEAECHPCFSAQRWQDPPEVTFCLLTASDRVLVPLFSQLWKPLPPASCLGPPECTQRLFEGLFLWGPVCQPLW